VNEAEPVTIHEAISRGIPVIAYGRGAIPEIITHDCGKVIDPAAPFIPAALEQIKLWLNDSTAYQAASKSAARRFSEIYTQNEHLWRELLDELIDGVGKITKPDALKDSSSQT